MSDVLTERSDAGIERSDDLTERSLASIERPSFDWKTPNYPEVFRERLLKLRRLRERPENFVYLKRYYRDHIADFINDWGITKDPRNVEIRRAALMPFLLWPKQRAWVEWVVDRWKNRQDGITEKSRDSGVTWLAVAVACSLCMLYDDMAIGFGSRKKEYVDDGSVPKSIFAKIRDYLRGMPPELTGWWTEDDSPSMRCLFPSTRSVISGECGDGIGRGDRTGIYFVDEAAHLEHPDTTDQALSQTTNCRIDISTPFGMANSFAIRRHSGRISVFSFSWRDDPRKDQAWYDKQKGRLDPVSLAQEIDGSYTASVEGLIIPAEVGAELRGRSRQAGDHAQRGPQRCLGYSGRR